MLENSTTNLKNPAKTSKCDPCNFLKEVTKDLLGTAFLLGVIDNLAPSNENKHREYLLTLAEKNPRVFSIVLEASSLREHIANDGKLF